MTRYFAPLLALGLTACASVPPASPTGEIRHYVRSNRDGSEAENVVHFRPTRTDVAVYKWVEKCETAALVTAQMDPSTWEPTGLDAGKVGKNGEQVKFGRIAIDPTTRLVRARADLPEGSVSDTATVPAGMPWFLFDYDLGDLNTYLQETRPTGDFTFAWALIWPEGHADFLTHMATIHAAHRGIQKLGGRAVRRFDLHFIAGKAGEGALFTDPETGAIVEAQASVPNHPGMKDFRLRLDHVETGGSAAWQRLMTGHYAACPR